MQINATRSALINTTFAVLVTILFPSIVLSQDYCHPDGCVSYGKRSNWSDLDGGNQGNPGPWEPPFEYAVLPPDATYPECEIMSYTLSTPLSDVEAQAWNDVLDQYQAHATTWGAVGAALVCSGTGLSVICGGLGASGFYWLYGLIPRAEEGQCVMNATLQCSSYLTNHTLTSQRNQRSLVNC